MANAYVVASGDEPEHGQQLPSDMWTEVLRHTAARFAVDWVCTIAYSVPRDPAVESWFDVIRGTVDVRLRYEFKLERRRATGARMLRARFTRCVCPLFKTTQAWLALTGAQQEAIEQLCARTQTFAPFEELRVELPEDLDSLPNAHKPTRFIFVRRHNVELSPKWSEIARRRLMSVRDQLQALFHMDLRDQHGQLVRPPREIWD